MLSVVIEEVRVGWKWSRMLEADHAEFCPSSQPILLSWEIHLCYGYLRHICFKRTLAAASLGFRLSAPPLLKKIQ